MTIDIILNVNGGTRRMLLHMEHTFYSGILPVELARQWIKPGSNGVFKTEPCIAEISQLF